MTRIVWLTPLFAIGCSQPEFNPDAFHWSVKVTGFEDDCNDPAVASADDYTYSLSYDETNASLAKLAIGWDTFATGIIAGCALSYDSPLVGEDRPEGFTQWELSGEGYFRSGGDSCSMADRVTAVYEDYPGLDFDSDWDQRGDGLAPGEVDWISVETFRVVAVDDEDGGGGLPEGCTYSSLVVGSYTETPS